MAKINLCKICKRVFSSKITLKKHLNHCRKFECDQCNSIFYTKTEIIKHFKNKCSFCKKNFKHHHSLKRHLNKCEKKIEVLMENVNTYKFYCETCKVYVSKRSLNAHFRSNSHSEKIAKKLEDSNVYVYQSALKKNVITFRIKNDNEDEILIENFFDKNKSTIKNLLSTEITRLKNIKFRISHLGLYTKPCEEETLGDGNIYECIKTFTSDFFLLNASDSIENEINEAVNQVIKKCQDFNHFSSGWSILRLIAIAIDVLNVKPFGGSFIATPKTLKNNKFILNVINNDDKCLIYSILAHLYQHEITTPVDKFESYLPYLHKINTKDLNFPLNFKEMDILENLNSSLELSFNIYDFDETSKKFGVVRLTKKEKKTHIDLLLVEENFNHHYILIKNLEKLVHKSITKNKDKIYLCRNCLTNFKSEKKFKLHKFIQCTGIAIKFPKSKYMQFNKFFSKQSLPFCIYFDIEAILSKISPDDKENSKSSKNSSHTIKKNKHLPLSCAYKIYSFIEDENLTNLRLYRGRNCIELFIKNVIKDSTYFYDTYWQDYLISNVTPEISNVLKTQTHCYVCEKKLGKKDIVMDHNHMVNEENWNKVNVFPAVIPKSNIRFLLHNKCNMNFKQKKFFLLISHNLGFYDSSFILDYLLHSKYRDTVCVIPKTKERFISFSFSFIHKGKSLKFTFIDSLLFLPSSLESISQSCEQLPLTEKYLKTIFPQINFKRENIGKLKFFYNLIDNYEICDEPNKKFPEIDKFYNDLTGKHIAQDEYDFTKSLYDSLKNPNYGVFYDIYLTIDVLLIYDVFQNFVENCLKMFKISPHYYFSMPGYAYACLFHFTKEKVEILRDVSIINIVSQNLKAGVVYGTQMSVDANNKYMNEKFLPNKPEKYILVTDCVGLYMYTMRSYPFPIGNYSWILENNKLNEIKENLMTYTKNDSIGYFLLCDIEYPTTLHNLHLGYPLLVERCFLLEEKVDALIPNLLDKPYYCAHYLLIQNAVKNGLKIKKIHAAVQFKQSFFLKPFLDFLAFKRQQQNISQFHSNLYKYMTNSIFGKFLEKVLDRRNIKFITNKVIKDRRQKTPAKIFSNPRIKNFNIIDENLVVVEYRKTQVNLNTFPLIGSAVLDLSKVHMSFLYYDIILNIFDRGHTTFIYSDTDSLFLAYSPSSEQPEDPYEIIKNNPYFFDCNSFNGICDIPKINSKINGFLSDETKGKIVSKFRFVRNKSYCLKFHSDEEKEDEENETNIKVKLKGIPRTAAKRITLQNFNDVINNPNKIIMSKINMFLKQNLQIYSIESQKIALKLGDKKRFWMMDNTSLPWGHKDIKDEKLPFSRKEFDANEFNAIISNQDLSAS